MSRHVGADVEQARYTREQRQQYREKVRRDLDVFERMLGHSQFEFDRPMTGIEVELNLVVRGPRPQARQQGDPRADRRPRLPDRARALQHRAQRAPRPLPGDSAFELEADLRRSLNRASERAAELNTGIVAIGILPTVMPEHFEGDWISENIRYAALNNAVLDARGEDVWLELEGPTGERIARYSDSLAPESACTSIQLHLQVQPERFADHWNAAQVLAGPQLALGANSPFFLGQRLWAETRIPLFTQATDTRSVELKNQGVRPRVWFGERWITSIFDLFEENVRYFPALLPEIYDEQPEEVFERGEVPELKELRLHNGTVYRWNRPIYDTVGGRPHLRVENRVLPAGPSIADVMANAAFYYGTMRVLAEEDRPVWTRMSFSAAEANFEEGARLGIDARAFWPGFGEVPASELDPAPPAADGPRGAVEVGRVGGRARPLPRHRRAALPHGRQRRLVADHVRRAARGPRADPRQGAARDAAPLHGGPERQRARAHVGAPQRLTRALPVPQANPRMPCGRRPGIRPRRGAAQSSESRRQGERLNIPMHRVERWCVSTLIEPGVEDEVLAEAGVEAEVGGGEHAQRVAVAEEGDVAVLEVGPHLVDDLLGAGRDLLDRLAGGDAGPHAVGEDLPGPADLGADLRRRDALVGAVVPLAQQRLDLEVARARRARPCAWRAGAARRGRARSASCAARRRARGRRPRPRAGAAGRSCRCAGPRATTRSRRGGRGRCCRGRRRRGRPCEQCIGAEPRCPARAARRAAVSGRLGTWTCPSASSTSSPSTATPSRATRSPSSPMRAALSDAQMQAWARQFNLSETAFVTGARRRRARDGAHLHARPRDALRRAPDARHGGRRGRPRAGTARRGDPHDAGR